MDRAASLTGQMGGHEREVHDTWVVMINDEQHEVEVIPTLGGYDVELDGWAQELRLSSKGADKLSWIMGLYYRRPTWM